VKMEDRRSAFSSCKTLAKALTTLRKFGACHKSYSFYTTLDRVEEMLSASTPCIWLTRINSNLFDDDLEFQKYGKEGDQNHTYIKCFTFRQQESAAMWGLYCPPTYKAIRVTVSQEAMKDLMKAKCYRIKKGKVGKVCNIRSSYAADIAYAAVQHVEGEDARSNILYWNEAYTCKIDNMEEAKDWKSSAGRVKDAEWRFEDETRLVVRVNDVVSDHIAIALPASFIDSMRFRLSPWANEKERNMVKTHLMELLESVHYKGNPLFKRSVLENSLVAWSKRRGL